MVYTQKLKELKECNNLMQKDLAKVVGLSKSQFCDYENETVLMPIKHLNTICNYFNVSLDYIFSFNNTKHYDGSKEIIDKKLVGARLKEFRKENNITQVKLANTLNTVHQVIANYENGRTLIATPFLYTICSKYKISADYLLGKVDSPKYLK